MHREGHYGAALIAYAPVGFVLLLTENVDLAVLGGIVTVALAPLPDIDLRLPLVSHRGATHTIGFALIVGGALASVGWVLTSGSSPETSFTYASLGLLAGTLSIGSHLLADVITPMGIRPLWPVSSRSYSLRLVRSDNFLANYGLLSAGLIVTGLVAMRFQWG